MNVIQYLSGLRPALPLSIEQAGDKSGVHQPMSNGELKRHIQQGGVLINQERIDPQEQVDFPVFSVIFFPNSPRRRTTIV